MKDSHCKAFSAMATADAGRWYVADNYVEVSPEVTADNWLGVDGHRASQSFAAEPWQAMPSRSNPPKEAYEAVLAHAGCSLPDRDSVDARIIEEVRTGTATYGNGIITTPNDVGGWPKLKCGDGHRPTRITTACPMNGKANTA